MAARLASAPSPTNHLDAERAAIEMGDTALGRLASELPAAQRPTWLMVAT
jgi:hypothetical protein